MSPSSVEHLPIFEPEFKVGFEYRMHILRILDERDPCEGLAIVWDGQEKITITDKLLTSRRPAVMRFPDMVLTEVIRHWKYPFYRDRDWFWKMEREETWGVREGVSGPHPILGGSWCPAKNNIAVLLSKKDDPVARAIAEDTRSRAQHLCWEYDLVAPYWLKTMEITSGTAK